MKKKEEITDRREHRNDDFDSDPSVMREHITVFRDGHTEIRREHVLTEYSLEISAGERMTMQVICTPEYLEELVLGRLLTAGIIKEADDVKNMEISGIKGGAAGKARVILRHDAPAGSGAADILQSVTPALWKTEWIFALADRFHQGMPLHDRTWGTHSCFLSSGGRLLFQCEDIGRHNAVDKAVGFSLKTGIDLSSCILYSSGRIPSDMAVKAIRAGIPVLAAKAVPTLKAIRLAEKYGLTLIGSARSDSMKVYTDGRKKILSDEAGTHPDLHFLTKKS